MAGARRRAEGEEMAQNNWQALLRRQGGPSPTTSSITGNPAAAAAAVGNSACIPSSLAQSPAPLDLVVAMIVARVIDAAPNCARALNPEGPTLGQMWSRDRTLRSDGLAAGASGGSNSVVLQGDIGVEPDVQRIVAGAAATLGVDGLPGRTGQRRSGAVDVRRARPGGDQLTRLPRRAADRCRNPVGRSTAAQAAGVAVNLPGKRCCAAGRRFPTSSVAAAPRCVVTTWSGTCAVRWPRCCSTTTTAQLGRSAGTAVGRRARRRPASAPRTIFRCNAPDCRFGN